MARGRDLVDLLAGEHVPELARLLLQPGDRLRVDDLALVIADALRQRRVLLLQLPHLRVDAAALGDLAVHGERDDATDDRDDGEPETAKRRRSARRGAATDGANLVWGVAETCGRNVVLE